MVQEPYDLDLIPIDDRPADDAAEDTGDNVVPGPVKVAKARVALIPHAEALLDAGLTPDVAFCRGLSKGDRGGDVTAHKRAVSRWNPRVYPWGQFTDFYGAYFETAVKEFQRRKKIKVDGQVGPNTHAAMEKAKTPDGAPAFDAYARKLAEAYCAEHAVTPEQRVRRAIVRAGFYLYSNRYAIAYSQARPFPLRPIPFVPSRIDCSGFATLCHFNGGAPDPNRLGYNGQGYTGTLISHGTRVASWRDLDLGDLVFYGHSSGGGPAFPPGSPTHVAVYAGDGMVLSMGGYPMRHSSVNYRHDLHSYVTYKVA